MVPGGPVQHNKIYRQQKPSEARGALSSPTRAKSNRDDRDDVFTS